MICANCNKEISGLRSYQTGDWVANFDGENYINGEFIPDTEKEEFCCPVCDATLAVGEVEATELLKKSIHSDAVTQPC